MLPHFLIILHFLFHSLPLSASLGLYLSAGTSIFFYRQILTSCPAQFSKSKGLPILEFILLFWVSDVPYFLCSLRRSHQHNSFVFQCCQKVPGTCSPYLGSINSTTLPNREPHLLQIEPKARKVAKAHMRIHAFKILPFTFSSLYPESVYN